MNTTLRKWRGNFLWKKCWNILLQRRKGRTREVDQRGKKKKRGWHQTVTDFKRTGKEKKKSPDRRRPLDDVVLICLTSPKSLRERGFDEVNDIRGLH